MLIRISLLASQPPGRPAAMLLLGLEAPIAASDAVFRKRDDRSETTEARPQAREGIRREGYQLGHCSTGPGQRVLSTTNVNYSTGLE